MNERTDGRDPAGDGKGMEDKRDGVPTPVHRLAVLVAEGTDAPALTRLLAAMGRHDVETTLVAPNGDRMSLSDGRWCQPDTTLSDGSRIRCDAIAMILSASSADRLAADPHARRFVLDAWHAGQAIAHDIGAALLLDACGIRGDEFVISVEHVADLLVYLPRRFIARTPIVSGPA